MKVMETKAAGVVVTTVGMAVLLVAVLELLQGGADYVRERKAEAQAQLEAELAAEEAEANAQ